MGVVVGALLLIGAVTAAAVLSTAGSPSRRAAGSGPTTPAKSTIAISSVSVFMANDRPPDNSSSVRYAFDGNTSTFWPTDQYRTAKFGNLYPGIGLTIHLSAAEQGRTLEVTSPDSGWAAETFVAPGPVESGQPVSAWGQRTDAKADIPAGKVTFKLGDRKSEWVLLWITNLGSPLPNGKYEGRIAELAIS